MEKVLLDGDQIFLVREFLTAAECDELIRLGEQFGFGEAPITTVTGFERRPDIRNNDRVMVDDPELAASYWDRLKPFMPENWRWRQPVGLNERFRFYRYQPGQRFAPHFDGCFERDNGERSQFTFMVYLNGDCEGGETRFFDCSPPLSVIPEPGTALVFYHHQLHEGAEVFSGVKYVLRTDVMYSARK